MLVFPSLPIRNPHVNAVGTKPIFQAADIERLRNVASEAAWQPGTVGTQRDGPTSGFANQAGVRQMMQQPVKVNNDGFPLNRVAAESCALNSMAWQFRLCGFVADDMPWIMRYREGGDHYDWHVDIGQNANGSRKLGFTVQLSASDDYQGGDLEFLNAAYDPKVLRQQGLMIVFPAYFTHRVTPVTSGERLALVGWIHGDSYA